MRLHCEEYRDNHGYERYNQCNGEKKSVQVQGDSVRRPSHIVLYSEDRCQSNENREQHDEHRNMLGKGDQR